jgi:predicted RNA-binding Zn ribbon-like protein
VTSSVGRGSSSHQGPARERDGSRSLGPLPHARGRAAGAGNAGDPRAGTRQRMGGTCCGPHVIIYGNPMARGRKPQSSWGPGTPFRSGAICLDLGYTGGFDTGFQGGERLREPDDLTQWLHQHISPAVAAADEQDLAHALELRSGIVDVARALAGGHKLPEDALARIDVLTARPGVPEQVNAPATGVSPWPVECALTSIAGNAAVIFSSRFIRVRVCAGQDCGLIFYDGSAAGARRWCSMSRCGNRAKVRAHRARKAGSLVA